MTVKGRGILSLQLDITIQCDILRKGLIQWKITRLDLLIYYCLF